MPNIFLGRNAESRFAFKSHAPDAPEFDVVKFEGREAISSLFWFDLTLVARTAWHRESSPTIRPSRP
jgi:uncharacterized protein involved in type VI secretion and phage assembly